MNETPSAGVFHLLDFDRCISDTDLVMNVYYRVLTEHDSILATDVKAMQRLVESRGESADIYAYVASRVSADDLDSINESFVQTARKTNMIQDGAEELMAYFKQKGEHFGILTYGAHRWQQLKMKATYQLDAIPRLVIRQKHKGDVISSWTQPDGTYRVPDELLTVASRNDTPTTYECITMTDDKASSFVGFPATQARGYIYNRSGYVTRHIGDGADDEQANIVIVSNLRDVISHELLITVG